MKNKIRVAVLGSTGYVGMELVKILSNHSYVDINFLGSETIHDSYLNNIDNTKEYNQLPLLKPNNIKEALVFGASMRLGAMLSVNIYENLRKTKIYIKENTLFLKLIEKDNLLGESVEKRFNHLGNLMNLKSKIIEVG